MFGGESKVQCYKEQYYIGTWNIRSINRGKLEVVKQEMARVNIDVLGISDLNGQEWVSLIHIAIMSTTVGKNPLIALIINKGVQNIVLGCNLKTTE